jgi:hypothetical protein
MKRNPNRVYNRYLSEHVNQWFHTGRIDDISPCDTVTKFNNKIMEYLNHWKLKLSLPESRFRKYMCEAVCTMYVSHKQETGWAGPYSEQPRPRDWSDHKESSWRDYMSYHYFNADFWARFWTNIEEAAWGCNLPDWRNSVQSLIPHYISVRSDLIDDTIDEDDLKNTVSATGTAVDTENDI